MAKSGVLEVGLFPEINYFDPMKVVEAETQIREFWNKDHGVVIRGISFDDKYFDEYRTDLDLPTPEDRIRWLAENTHVGNQKLIPGKLANFQVEKPQRIDLSVKE